MRSVQMSKEKWIVVCKHQASEWFCRLEVGTTPVTWEGASFCATRFDSEAEAWEIARGQEAAHRVLKRQALRDEIVLPDYTFDVIMV
jgi:hypothetical protein